MVVNNLPIATLPTIDIRDAVFDGGLEPAERERRRVA